MTRSSPDPLRAGVKRWPRRPPPLPRALNKAGLNLFTWNARYPDAAAFWGMVGVQTDGPMALPGTYRARLRVGGRVYTASFALRVDPRAKVTPADLRDQFTFLKLPRDTVNAATTAIAPNRDLRQRPARERPRASVTPRPRPSAHAP